jgi:hypothetical protein
VKKKQISRPSNEVHDPREPALAIQLGKEKKMAKRVISADGINTTSLQAMVNTLGKLIGDEVYIRKVLEVESSEPVLKALDAVLEGVKQRQAKTPKKE